MRLNFFKILTLALTLLLASCGTYNKLLKGDDNEMKFSKALEYYKNGKYSKSTALLQDIGSVYAGTPKEDSIAYYLGASAYKQSDFFTSGAIFDEFRRRYGRSTFLEDVEYMYARGFYFSSPMSRRDQGMTRQALMAIGEYLGRYPNSPKREQLLENINQLTSKLHEKSFQNAKVYYNIGYYNSAVVALQNALDEYPETPYREELMYLIVSSHYEYAHNSVPEQQRERYLNLQDAYYSFVSEYPESKRQSQVDKMQEEAVKFLAKYNTGTENGEQKK